MKGFWARSWYVTKVLTKNEDYKVKYSHNAFRRKGSNMIWHGTFSDNPKYNGFCEEPCDTALAGSVVRFCRDVKIRYTPSQFDAYLDARRNTPYSQSQNLAAVRPRLFDIPIIRNFFKNGKAEINCSEVLAEVCDGGVLIGADIVADVVLKFGDLDRVKPTDTYKKIKPLACTHSHAG